MFEEKERIRKMQEQKRLEEEKKQKLRDKLNKFEDERDLFKYEVPLLAPKDFKPLKKHRPLCKICYEQKINTAIIPCTH